MKQFVAKGSRQVDLCMRMLFDESIEFRVIPQLDDKEKVYYVVEAALDDQKLIDKLETRYKRLIK